MIGLYFSAGFVTAFLSMVMFVVFLRPRLDGMIDEVKSEVEADVSAMHRTTKSTVLQELKEEILSGEFSDKHNIVLKEVVEKHRAEIETETVRKLQAALEESGRTGDSAYVEFCSHVVTVIWPTQHMKSVRKEVHDAR